MNTGLEESATLTPEERELLVDLLISTRDRFAAAIHGLLPHQLGFRPAAESWTVAECAEHIAVAEDVLRGMVREQIVKLAPVPEKRSEVQSKDGLVVRAMRDRS